MTLEDLKTILVENAGADDSGTLDGDFAAQEFTELGYDSLALLELAAGIQRRYGIVLPDEQVMELRTPEAVLAAVNSAAVNSAERLRQTS
ncbi:acyl carrier protein [Frankia sp. AiPs1]|uniref:acyl carrier protein n=1 Tax=Frankia sp. AiPs1 TaxID=573493 RepID=UPI0020444E23|nr:acyl carrier protein [Frankia sp. AiPs1]